MNKCGAKLHTNIRSVSWLQKIILRDPFILLKNKGRKLWSKLYFCVK